jgi:type I restriction enzyme S subunit
MSKDVIKRVVPKLRFPEFRDAEDWEAKQLIDVCKMQAGKFVRAADINEKKKHDMYPCYGANGLRGFTKTFTHAGRYSLIGRQGALCGNITLVTGEFHATEHAVVTTPKEGVYSNWLFYKLTHLNLNQYATGQAQPGLSVDNLERVAVEVSKKEEQQKIADCLSSIDELITAHSQKHQALKAHKKGLMQQLFPAIGETVPKLRFPEFDEDLKTVGFAELGEIKIGLTHKPKYIKSGKPFLSSKNISNGYIDFKNIKYISEEKFSSMPESTKPKVGDILFTRVGSNLGNPIILEEGREFGIFVSLGIFRANKKVSNYYIKHWMDSDYFWVQVKQKVAGGAKDNLNITWLKEFKLSIPLFSEQQKIANCLSSIDDLITTQAQKIESLKAHKKGLMQQLFPAADDDCMDAGGRATQDAKAEVNG